MNVVVSHMTHMEPGNSRTSSADQYFSAATTRLAMCDGNARTPMARQRRRLKECGVRSRGGRNALKWRFLALRTY